MQKYFLIVALLLSAAVQSAQSTDVPRAEFIKVTHTIMMQPCTIPAYISCLELKEEFCKESVKTSLQTCEKKVNIPENIPRAGLKKLLMQYGHCMTQQVSTEMKLTQAKLAKCETVLKTNTNIDNSKK